jgi:hypothetical protein
MGNRPSQTTEYAVTNEELDNGPHSFYLVMGKPSLRYVRNRVRGPLIYDVNVEYDEDDGAIEHTATLDLGCAVPRRQRFDLVVPPPPAAASSTCTSGGNVKPEGASPGSPTGLALTFRVAATTPPRRIRVLTGVSLEYRAGDGIHLTSGDVSPSSTSRPRCVFDTTAAAGLDTVVTRADIVPQHLRPVELEGTPNAIGGITAQRVTYAPLVIEVDVGEADESMHRSGGGGRPAGSRKAGTEAEAVAEDRGAAAHSPPFLPSSVGLAASPPPARKRILQYTLLELPGEASTALAGAAAAAGEGEVAGPSVRVACKVCKQLLQVGTEVYDLEDVFDVGRDEDVVNPQADPDEDEDVCVICLTNPKDTTVLPCRHMCLCSDCAAQLLLSNNRCPLCRGNIDRLMTI